MEGLGVARSRSHVIGSISDLFGKPVKAASAPGRADFLNTHQDYKGLPVVPVALNLRTYAIALREQPDCFEIVSLNIKRDKRPYLDKFPLAPRLREGGWFGDYLRACVIALRQIGYSIDRGLCVVIDSDVPAGGGLGSSAALEVAFLKLLDAYFGFGLSKKELAELAFRAENEIMGIPCGRLDQYGSSYGHAVLLNTRPPYDVKELPLRDIKLVVADSGIKHRVAAIHPVRQAEIERGLEQLLSLVELPQDLKALLGKRYWEPLWEKLDLQVLEPYLRKIDPKASERIKFTILMHESTLLALKLIEVGSLNAKDLERIGAKPTAGFLETLGAILNRQHELLRDLYEVSLPELEKLRNAMLAAGAYGVKISGAGLGGALIALTDEERSAAVAKAALREGAKRAWLVEIDEGAREEPLNPNG